MNTGQPHALYDQEDLAKMKTCRFTTVVFIQNVSEIGQPTYFDKLTIWLSVIFTQHSNTANMEIITNDLYANFCHSNYENKINLACYSVLPIEYVMST